MYARYSSDLQTDSSIEDQIRIVEERAQQEGWTIVNKYTDHGISGASMMRPRIQMLMQDAADGKFDIVIAEALDRLSRDQEDIAKDLNKKGIKGPVGRGWDQSTIIVTCVNKVTCYI